MENDKYLILNDNIEYNIKNISLKIKKKKEIIPKYKGNSSVHCKNTIYWGITRACNLKCGFCDFNEPAELVKKQFKLLTENWPKIRDNFKGLNEKWEIFISGGEPFLVPNFINIVRDLVRMGHKISIATNLTYPIKHYTNFLDLVDKNLILFLASYKPDFYTFEPYLEKAQIINKIVKNNKGKFVVGAVATKKDINLLYNLGLDFRKNDIKFELQTQRTGKYHKINYTEEEKKKIKEFGRVYGLDSNNCFKDKYCYAGINFFFLNPYLNAYRCLDLQTEFGYLGNFTKNDFKLYKTPKKCPCESCMCIIGKTKNLF